jgi:acetylornithine/succinyldiaminopimelate/putrescine aminotransferase
MKDVAVVAAHNSTVEAADGRTFTDMGGLSHGAAIVGHSHPAVVAAIRGQLDRVVHAAHLYPNPARDEFLAALHARLPRELSRTFLVNSGAEAVEVCLKSAVAATGRGRFVAAENGFHGRTLGAVSVTHKTAFRGPVAAVAAPCDFVPFGDAAALAAAVTRDTAAVILEPVQGEGGVVPAPDGYLRAARDITADAGALLILDEVQSGLCRTGPFLASASADGHADAPQRASPADMVALGKGLAGGLPVGAAVMTDDIAGRLPPALHGTTYGGSPLVCAAASAVLGVLRDERLDRRAARVGATFAAALRAISHPAIAEVRAVGMMVNVDLRVRPAPVLRALQERGFLALAGARGVRFLPPLTIDEVTLAGCATALDDACREVASAARPEAAHG